ncbi:hypothetical protein BOTBODRAFT_32643 [Botryobasidium botryosum FD-172 SS1]|uniref:Uncharacterized protein n=1 Tax=Botryobasidium botryosum (strain FD-172 SS1) TaxID=930990 RepID=A0A067MFE9_BOTB1|nr:hypothetical protein BOTBODRAFT_32643 [Botryobasidium botryosum FD-172 SS1]
MAGSMIGIGALYVTGASTGKAKCVIVIFIYYRCLDLLMLSLIDLFATLSRL